ncbi:hypothetical protein D3C81_1108460 [compost metagenome]
MSRGDQGIHSSRRSNEANAASASQANASATSPTSSAPIQNARRWRHSRQRERPRGKEGRRVRSGIVYAVSEGKATSMTCMTGVANPTEVVFRQGGRTPGAFAQYRPARLARHAHRFEIFFLGRYGSWLFKCTGSANGDLPGC